MARTKKDKPEKIPEFRNEQEAGEFWDTHSPLDFPGEFEEVEVHFTRDMFKNELILLLGIDTFDELRQAAKEKGVEPSDLVQTWIVEQLEKRKSANSTIT